MTASAVVTLLTDFGLSDLYVGIMKGVLLAEDPSLRIVDLSHAVPQGDVDLAAFWLDHAFSWFPPGSVHVCVVDPGVGSARAPLAVSARGHSFVAPDNGVLSDVLAGDPGAKVRRIEPRALGLSVPSRTFHGRDVFAPVAARLASEKHALADLGPAHEPLIRPRTPPEKHGDAILGHIVFVDHFGNLISDVPADWLPGSAAEIAVGERRFRLVSHYAEADPGECVALVSSFGTLEVACRDGSAARALGVSRGASVRVGDSRAALPRKSG